MDKEFQGKTLVISDGARGIGKVIAYEFAKMGVNTAFTYNSNTQITGGMVKDLGQNCKIKARAYEFNILELETYRELFERIDADFERVDLFILDAIISGRAAVDGYTKFMKLKLRGINSIFAATANVFVMGSQETAKRMKKAGRGGIVSILSTGSLVYIENYAGHSIAKATVEAMARYVTTESGDRNIRVNVVSGGPIETDALRVFINHEEVKQATINLSPLNRIGQSRNLARTCLLLCPSETSRITRHTLIVDGDTTFK